MLQVINISLKNNFILVDKEQLCFEQKKQTISNKKKKNNYVMQ
jgi:hypothetical protein